MSRGSKCGLQRRNTALSCGIIRPNAKCWRNGSPRRWQQRLAVGENETRHCLLDKSRGRHATGVCKNAARNHRLKLEQNTLLQTVVAVPLSTNAPAIWPLRLRLEMPNLKISYAI